MFDTLVNLQPYFGVPTEGYLVFISLKPNLQTIEKAITVYHQSDKIQTD